MVRIRFLKMATRSPWPLVSVEEAVRVALSHAVPLSPVVVPIASAIGLILAEDVVAAEPHPPFRASIKDGFAVCFADGAGVFPVVSASRAAAADGPPPALKPGTVVYVTTGAPLPDGADAVVQVENTEDATVSGGPKQIRIVVPARSLGEDVRQIGSDMPAGCVVLQAGVQLGASEVALLASVGAATVAVHPVPRGAVLSTGDELADAATPPGGLLFGQVRDSNRPMLLAALTETGCAAADWGRAADDDGGLRARLAAAVADLSVTLLITSGGVSMGDRDLVTPLLLSMGVIHYGRVLMKPGKPLTFATIPRASGRPLLVFGLPGNPVSSLVTFHLVVVPVLRRFAGWPSPQLRRVCVTTAEPLRLDPERPEYHRATLSWGGANGELLAHSTGTQVSSRLLSARSVVVLMELPAAAGTLPAGTRVSALLIGNLAAAEGLLGSRIDPTVAAPMAPVAPPMPAEPFQMPIVGVLTVSDRASQGVYADVSGPAIVAVLQEYLATEVRFLTRIVPDEQPLICVALREMVAEGACLVCTTGGTGPAARDVTPEAMDDVCEKMLPGFGEAMRAASLRQGVPTAILSRQTAGTLGRALLLNIPGKPAAVRVCLDAVWGGIPYCIDLLGGPRLEGKANKVPVFRPKT